MSKLEQAKLVLQLNKVRKQLKRQIFQVETGDGAVVVETNGEMKVKKIYIDPDAVDPEKIEQIEDWLVSGINDSLSQAKKAVEEKTKPLLEKLGLGR